MDATLSSSNGIKAETDFTSIRRQNPSAAIISDALLDAKTHVLEGDGYCW